MGCLCSKPQADSFGAARADVRARYSLDVLRNDAADGIHGVQAFQQQAHAVTTGLSVTTPPGSRSSNPRNGITLSRSQWKQMRALARSNANPHYHQLQQLQLLPSHALFQQHAQRQQQLPAAFDAVLVGLQQQQRHQHPVAHITLGPGESLIDVPRQQGSDIGQMANNHHSASNLGRAPSAAHRDLLSAEQVLALCGVVVQEYGPALVAAGIQPLLLASVCLIESGGCPQARHYREHVGEVALGLGQVLLSTAQWLSSSQGFDRYGSPTASDLEDPKRCLYFCAAYLAVLSQHHGLRRSESFLIKAYHAGPKGVHTEAASQYWQKYLKAKHCLKEVARAMAVTVATAAATAGPWACMQPLCKAVEVPVCQGIVSSHAKDVPTHWGISDQQGFGKTRDCATPTSDAAAVSDDTGGSTCSSGTSSDASDGGVSHNMQSLVWSNAAPLIGYLSSTWEGGAGVVAAAADSANAAAPAESDASSNSGSFISQLLPSFWQGGSSSRSQQQQQQPPGNTSTANAAGRRRRLQIDGAASEAGGSSSTSRGSITLVPVSRAALAAALLRLSCIDHSSTCMALSNAAAAVQLHSSWVSQPANAAANAPTTSRGSSTSWQQRLRNSFAGTASSSTAKSTNAASIPPYIMHVVAQGETVSQIAAACNLALSDILAVNPELPDVTAVQPSDCIALPVPVVPPRVYVAQPGDTLPSIAKAHRISMGRLLARNPELTDPTRLQPGWVVALPGLKGDSKCGVAMQLLVAEAAAEAAAPAQGTAAWPDVRRNVDYDDAVELASGHRVQNGGGGDNQADTTDSVFDESEQKKGADDLDEAGDELVPQDQNQPGTCTAAAIPSIVDEHDESACTTDAYMGNQCSKPAGRKKGSAAGHDRWLLQRETVGSGMFMFATGQSLG